MNASQVIEIYERLLHQGIDMWILGGWGIDALLGRQTRAHHDLDLLVKVHDVVPLLHFLEAHTFSFAYLWEENQWIVIDGERMPTAFVWRHEDGRELDFHAAWIADQGAAVPAWKGGLDIGAEDLAGRGTIDGVPVRCYSAEMQMRAHRGYALPTQACRDLQRLHKELGVDYHEGIMWPDDEGTEQ